MMPVNLKMFCFLVLLSNIFSCSQEIVSITPMNSLNWLGSYIKITCKTNEKIRLQDCGWYLNNQKVSNMQTYQFSLDHNRRECIVVVKSAGVFEDGEWKCRLYPLASDVRDLNASTNVTVLKITFREFVIIVCSIIVFLGMTIFIKLLSVKYNRARTLVQEHNLFATVTVALDEEVHSGTPPPSYDTVVDERLAAVVLARLQLFSHRNKMKGRSSCSLQNCREGDDELTFKTRSAPSLI